MKRMETDKKFYFLRVEGTKAPTAMVNALREYCRINYERMVASEQALKDIVAVLNGKVSEMAKAHPRWTAVEVKLNRGMPSTWVTAGSDMLMYATNVRRIEL